MDVNLAMMSERLVTSFTSTDGFRIQKLYQSASYSLFNVLTQRAVIFLIEGDVLELRSEAGVALTKFIEWDSELS